MPIVSMKARRALVNVVMGTRREFGDGVAAMEHATAAALRHRRNWTLPLLLGGCITGGILIPLGLITTEIGFGYVFFRIIPLDYLIFLFGWLCAWNAATRWRQNQEFVEALVLTSLRPRVVGNLLLAGSMSIWARLLVFLACLETVIFLASSTMSGMWYSTKFVLSDFLAACGWTLVQLPVVVPFYLVMAWFHLETIRIAYWMFAVAALPRVDLRRRALLNFVLIPLYVGLLTGIGSIITGLTWMPAMIATGVVASSLGFVPTGGEYYLWMLAALPGLLLVAYIKRQIALIYEREFEAGYLLFTWWGAGETVHPASYPPELQKSLGPWQSFLRKEEAALRQADTA